MPEPDRSTSRKRAIFELIFTSLLVGITAGAGPLGIIAMQYTSDRVSYWHGAIGGSILAVLVVAGFLLYQDWQGQRRIFSGDGAQAEPAQRSEANAASDQDVGQGSAGLGGAGRGGAGQEAAGPKSRDQDGPGAG